MVVPFLGFADNGVVGRAFAAEDRIETNGLEPEAARFLPVRGFYMPSYDVNGLVGGATETQLNALRAQVPSASHVALAVHVRSRVVSGATRSFATPFPRIPATWSDLLPGIAALPDFIGVTAYVPLSDANAPSYQEIYENLTGTSWVDSVRSLVSEKAVEWRRPLKEVQCLPSNIQINRVFHNVIECEAYTGPLSQTGPAEALFDRLNSGSCRE